MSAWIEKILKSWTNIMIAVGKLGEAFETASKPYIRIIMTYIVLQHILTFDLEDFSFIIECIQLILELFS